jgi:hypothetical protein
MKRHFQYCFASLLAFCILASSSQAQSCPPAWVSTTNYKIGDLVTYVGNTFQCLANETTAHPNPHQPGWRVTSIYTGNFSIPVGPTESFKTLETVWAYIANAQIAPTSFVVLKLDSTYDETFQASFSLNHPFGSQISIEGVNDNGPAAHFVNFSTGFTLSGGHTFGGIEYLAIEANSVYGSGGNAGIQVSLGSVMLNVQNVTFDNFDLDLLADTSSTINVQGIFPSGFRVGVAEATNGGTIICTGGMNAQGPTNGSFVPQFGMEADGGTISCGSAFIANCTNDYVACRGGKIEADGTSGTSPSTNTYNAIYYAYDHGYIHASGTTADGANYCFYAIQSSFIDAGTSTPNLYNIYGFYSTTGGTIDATGHHGGSGTSNGSSDGSYIFGL